MKYLKRLLRDTLKLDNFELIPVVILGLIIFVFEILGIDNIFGKPLSDLLPSLTLMALGLLAIGLLFTRYRIEETYLSVDPADLVTFSIEKNDEVALNLKNSDEILLIGINLRKTTLEYYENLRTIGKRGGHVKALIANPNAIDMNDLTNRFGRGRATIEQYLSAFDQTILQFENIRRFNEESGIYNTPVELRALTFIPIYSLYIFPKAQNGAFAFVEIYGYKSSEGSMPKFKISKKDNPLWYEFFLSQFEKMWSDAEPIRERIKSNK